MPNHKHLFLRLCRKVSGGGRLNGMSELFRHVDTADFCGSCFVKEKTGIASEISNELLRVSLSLLLIMIYYLLIHLVSPPTVPGWESWGRSVSLTVRIHGSDVR